MEPARYHLYRGTQLLTEGRTAEAMDSFRQAANLDPNAYQAWLNLGMNLPEHQLDERLAAFEAFLRTCPAGEGYEANRNFAERFLISHGRAVPAAEPGTPQSSHPVEMLNATIRGKRALVQVENDSGVPLSELLETLTGFIQAPTWLDAFLILREHTELLSSAADVVMNLLAQTQDEEGRLMVQTNIELFRRFPKIGVGAAFAEAMNIAEAKFWSLVLAVDELQPKMQELFSVSTPEEKITILQRYPELLSEGSQQLLAHLKELQPAENRAIFDYHIWALQRARQRGVHAAFAISEEEPGAHDGLATVRLAETLMAAYQASGNPSDLAEALRLLEPALQEMAAGSWDLAVAKAILANALTQEFERTGDLHSIDRAIVLARESLQDLPEASDLSAGVMNALARASLLRGRAMGSLTDLDAAVDVFSKASALAGSGDTTRASRLMNLGFALVSRFNVSEVLGDLDAALRAYDEARKDVTAGSPLWGSFFSGYGAALNDYHRATGDIGYLDLSVTAYEEGLSGLSEDAIDRGLLENNLGNAMRSRFLLTARREDIDRAVIAGERAVAAPGHHRHELPMWQENLAKSLMVRSRETGQRDDLDTAIDLFGQVLLAYAPGARAATCRANLGSALMERYRLFGENQDDARAAIKAWEESLAELDSREQAMDIVGIVTQLSDLYFAFEAWPLAAAVLSRGLEALDDLYERQITLAGQKASLGRGKDLYSMAAYAIARTGQLREAVTLLEKGRARALTGALGRSLTHFQFLIDAGHIDLFERLRLAIERLDQLSALQRSALQTDASLGPALKDARSRLDRLYGEVRELPGYDAALLPPGFEEIRRLSQDIQLLYLVATEAGGMALLVRHREEQPVDVVWLPELTSPLLRQRIDEYLDAQDKPEIWLSVLDSTTRWLWEILMEPVVAALTVSERVLILPTGLLGLLPLHAAWSDAPASGRRRYVLDLVEVSYAPNVRAYEASRSRASHAESDGLLTLHEPAPVSALPLPHSEAEVRAAARYFTNRRELQGAAATREAVLGHLPNYPVLHCACHARADISNPLHSGLVLAEDELLTLQDLLELKSWKARLALLSACETAVIGLDLPDEAMSLASGLLQAGIPGVVASLWSVSDISTSLLVSRFFDLWRGQGLPPASALRSAQRWLRDGSIEALGLADRYRQLYRSGGETDTSLFAMIRYCQENPQEQPFSHPFFWAGFTLTGV